MTRFFFALGFFFLASFTTVQAQHPITIAIETQNQATVLQTDKDNRLGIVYFGNKLRNTGEYALVSQQSSSDENSAISNNAYTPAGTWNLLEPAIQVVHNDGNTSLELKYVSHNTKKLDDNVSLTSVLLKDPVYAFSVTLFYKTYYKENVVEQWSVLEQAEKGPVLLKKYASANLFFSYQKYFLTQFHGGWAQEMKPEATELTAGIKTLDSKLGTRANLFQPPTFALSFG